MAADGQKESLEKVHKIDGGGEASATAALIRAHMQGAAAGDHHVGTGLLPLMPSVEKETVTDTPNAVPQDAGETEEEVAGSEPEKEAGAPTEETEEEVAV